MARPTLFTPARAALIVRTIRETGCSLGAAARVAGIGESTLRDWRKRGAQELSENAEPIEAAPDGEPQSFGQFVVALEQVLAGVEARMTRCLITAADRDWRAGAWWLERRRPELYGVARATAELDGDVHPDNSPASIHAGPLDMLSAESVRAYVRRQLALNVEPTATQLRRLEMLEAHAAELEAKQAKKPAAELRLIDPKAAAEELARRMAAKNTGIAEMSESVRLELQARQNAARNHNGDGGHIDGAP